MTRFGVLVAIVAGILLAPASDAAWAGGPDPRCDLGGVMIGDYEPEALDRLPASVPIDREHFSCVGGYDNDVYFYYFDQSFDIFLSTVAAFEAAGWVGDEYGAPLAPLEGREADSLVPIRMVSAAGEARIWYYADLASTGQTTGGLSGPALLVHFQPPAIAKTGAVPASHDFGDPGILSQLRTVGEAVPNAAQTAALVIGAALVTALVGFPGLLLGAVISGRQELWLRWGRGLQGRLAALPRRRLPRPLVFALAVLAAAVITGFIDPDFGFNLMSLRVVLTQVAAFAAFNIGGWLVIRAVHRRIGAELPALAVRPLSLIAVAVLVVLSRLLVIEPGIVLGLITGLVFVGALALTQQARVILIGVAYAAVVGVVSWVLFSVSALGGDGLVGLQEFFSGLTLAGVATLPVALLPLAGLDGATVFRWSRLGWAAAYAIGAGIFMLVVLHLPAEATAVPADFARWILIFAAFAVAASGVWLADLLVRRRSVRRSVRVPMGASPTTEGVE